MRKNKIRILHVAQAAGGVDRYIRMLLKYLDKEKFENILVCSQDFHEEDYRGLADSFEQVEMTRAIGGNDLKAIREVRALIKKYNPNIVYAHSSKAGAIARVADIGLRNHCVYNPHGWAFNMRCSAKKKAIYTMIEKIAAPFCDKIICISDAEKQSALDKKICKEDKLQVIFNGVDIEAYENGAHGAVKRQDLNIPEDAFVVGMVGRISQQKAPDVFIKMAKQVKDEVPNAHFIIVGNGNQEDEIRKYAKDNGFSDSLHITGWVNDPMSYVELFDVACLLSRWEGFGLALPEYMMAGKPIVASRVDAIPNIIRDGENGLLVEVDDYVGASNAVLRIYQEDGLKDRLVTQGMEDSLVSMNMWGLTPDFLDVMEDGFKEFFEKEVAKNPLKAEYLIPTFIGELLDAGKMSVKVLRSNDTWYGMTYHEDVASVKDSFKKMLEKGLYKADLFSDL